MDSYIASCAFLDWKKCSYVLKYVAIKQLLDNPDPILLCEL